MENLYEKNLIESILDGKTEAFEQLIRKHQRPVFALIRSIVSSREDAEELTQDVFVKVFQKLNTFKGNSSFSTWIFRIAYNTAISSTRKRRYDLTEPDEALWSTLADETVDEQLEQSENEAQWLRLERAVDQLSVEESVLIRLYYSEDKSMAELAEILQIGVENAKVKLHRTRRKIVHLSDVPYGFEQQMMRRIMQEKIRMERRAYRRGVLLVTLVSFVLIALLILVSRYVWGFDFFEAFLSVEVTHENRSLFYGTFWLGMLITILLGLDAWIRQKIQKSKKE